MNKDKQLKGSIGLYFRWPLLTAVILTVVSIVGFIEQFRVAYVLGGVTVVYIGVTVVLYLKSSNQLLSSIEEYAHKYSIAQDEFLNELSIPYALMYESGIVNWMNQEFRELSRGKVERNESISRLFPTINSSMFPRENGQTVSISLAYGNRNFRLELRKICVEDFENTLTASIMKVPSFICVYVHDETELKNAIRKNRDDALVAGLVYIDNYEDMMSQVEEVRQSMLGAYIDQTVVKYFTENEGLVKKLQRDKYYVVLKRKHLDTLMAARFTILESVKTAGNNPEIIPTVSIGIGVSDESYVKTYDNARMAIDLAMGRGGDQAVVKDGEKIHYYGGKTQETTSATRVKARVKAEALREFISAREHIVVMGHKIADVDSFGASMGIYRVAKTLGKKCNVVLDDVTVSLRPLMEAVKGSPGYEKDIFITNEKARRIVNENTMVVVVDTNRPSFTQCPELLDRAGSVVVIDHHRQMTETISRAVLSYIEPAASSASEMVAEILQYTGRSLKMTRAEANSLYAGIIIDTNNFTNKTGVRTFEAAAYLRRNGADIVRVRKIFRDDFKEYQAKAETIRNAEIYRNAFAIGIFPEADIESPTVIGSQAANELLNISGIKASFVLTDYNGVVYISARSIDEVNVQLVMEKMGGGGHMSIAGAQIEDTSVEEAAENLKRVLDRMLEGGEIQ